MANIDRIQLAGLRKGGPSIDGDYVTFDFQAQDGREFHFSCPHEAITEIVEALELLAEMAWKQRGSPNQANIAPGTRMSARARTVTGTRVDIAREGIVLSLLCGPLTHQVLLQPADCNPSSDALRQAPAAWKREFPSH